MDSNAKQKKTTIEDRESLVSRKIWSLEQSQIPIIDVGDVDAVSGRIDVMDHRIVNDYPDGQDVLAKTNTGLLIQLKIKDGKILQGNSTYTEV